MQEGFCVSLAFESSTLDSLGYVTLHAGSSPFAHKTVME